MLSRSCNEIHPWASHRLWRKPWIQHPWDPNLRVLVPLNFRISGLQTVAKWNDLLDEDSWSRMKPLDFNDSHQAATFSLLPSPGAIVVLEVECVRRRTVHALLVVREYALPIGSKDLSCVHKLQKKWVLIATYDDCT